jgi:hypothetical protein
MPRKYSVEMVEYVRSIAGGKLKTEILAMLNAKYNTELTADKLKNLMSRNKITSGRDCKFKKGHESWNKGLPMSPDTLEKLRPTLFKKGNAPWTHREVGSTRIDKDGHLVIKVSETGAKKADWVPIKNLVWAMHNGKVPEGHIVIVLDGDKTNLNIANLACITRGENATLNKCGMRFEHPELTNTAINMIRVKNKLRKIKGKNDAGKDSKCTNMKKVSV